ncbi:D-alanine--D-alanine ligase [Oxobacter pfennigii]|uniref:D-alanine--D-alanine ligase n=1 Tax=Oxobacter pfennigii TaxID=36849 RepID=A0A0P8WPV0_9CLOT|nr:D-alanine--D-alanine ligase family protein [Oxobacter pfennigii]KPU44588.1 D-alanine--D-alanine ligase [Oxobacter pfennigii]
MPKLNVGVLFGGRSVEHEVSVVTGLQVVENIDKTKYDVTPIYISKDGDWYTGEELLNIKSFKNIEDLLTKLRKVFLPPVPSLNSLFYYPFKTGFFKREAETLKVDVIFPALHGMHGEDGTVQGLLELSNIPYVGSGVTGSAVGMDKIIMKDILKANDIPIVNYTWFFRKDYERDKDSVVKNIESKVKYPMFVKPANLGSSIGISKAKNVGELIYAIEIAIKYDRKIIVEEGVINPAEINCSITGREDEVFASTLEMPVTWQEFLSFDDKYMSGNSQKGMKSATRKIPAPIPDEKSDEIKELAKKTFMVLDCSGISRIDFLMEKDTMKIYVNEINTMPGSVAFYLWEPEGVDFKSLIDRMINTALDAHREHNRNIYTFDTKLLLKASSGSIKGGKNRK